MLNFKEEIMNIQKLLNMEIDNNNLQEFEKQTKILLKELYGQTKELPSEEKK